MSRRSRSRSRASPVLKAFVAALAIVGVMLGGAGTGAFETGAFERGSSVPVASDADSLLGLDIAPSVPADATDRLVTVTNSFDGRIEVAIALRGNATEVAALVVDGTTAGDTATVTVAPGDSRTVDIAVEAGVEDGATLRFDADASGDGVGVSARNRSTTVTA